MPAYKSLIYLVLLLAAGAPAQTVIGGAVNVNTTLTAALSPYAVTSDLIVGNGATLTIEPGVTIRFGLLTELIVSNGVLNAQGTPGSPITFTTSQAAPVPGSWEGIRISFVPQVPGSSVLRDCFVDFAGRGNVPAINIQSTAAHNLQRVTVRNCLQDGVAVNFSPSPILQNVTVENAGRHGVLIAAGSTGAPAIDQLTVTNPGNYGVLVSNASPQSSLTNSTVQNGIQFPNSTTFTMQVSGNTFSNYHAFPNRAGSAMVGPFLNGNTFTGVVAGSSELQVLGGTVSQSVQWPSLGIVYRATALIDVGGNQTPTLSIGSGARLQFAAAASLRIGVTGPGLLVAQGTPASPITFTTASASPAPGQWPGILFQSAPPGSILEHVVVEYGGSTSTSNIATSSTPVTIRNATVRFSGGMGVQASNSAVSITDSAISNNTTFGVRFIAGASDLSGIVQNNTFDANGSFPAHFDVTVFPELGGNVYTNNGTQAIEVGGGNANHDFTLANEGLPYRVTSSIVVGPTTDSTLTVVPGVIVRFGAARSLIFGTNGSGTLNAQGTRTLPITFTADTAFPTPGFWSGITLNRTTPATVMRHCVVEYGGSGAGGANLALNSSSPLIERCTFRNGGAAGVRLSSSSGSPAVTTNIITANAIGISVGNVSGSETVVNNDISGNTTGLSGPTAGLIIGARANWWGAASGPSGSGPGSGNPVTATVAFEPYLTQAPVPAPRWTDALVSPQSIPVPGGQVVFSAGFSESVDWTLTVRNSQSAVVRSFSGSGMSLSQTWNGTDAGGLPLPDGTYTFEIGGNAPGAGQPLPPAAGDVSLLGTAHVALITSPADDEVILSNVPYAVMGTTSTGYTLQIGVGPEPAIYTNVSTGGFAVTNGTLGSFTPQNFLPGPHTLRLTVGTSPNQAVHLRRFTLDFISITGVTGGYPGGNPSPSVAFDPSAGQTVTFGYTLNHPADTVVLRMYSFPGVALRSTVTALAQPAGTNSIVWDGRTVGGTIVPDGAYFFTLEATNALGQRGTFNDATDPIMPQGFPFWSNAVVTGDGNYDPYRNDVVTMAYTLTIPMISTLQIHSQSGGSPTFSFRNVIFRQARDMGSHAEFWDGRRDDGSIHQGVFFPYYGTPEKFPVHGVIVEVPEPAFLNYRSQAYVIQNGYREVSTLAYQLTRDALVTIAITDPNGTPVRTLVSSIAQAAGLRTVEWDGRDDAGRFVHLEGDYRADLGAVDAVTGRSGSRVGTVTVYR